MKAPMEIIEHTIEQLVCIMNAAGGLQNELAYGYAIGEYAGFVIGLQYAGIIEVDHPWVKRRIELEAYRDKYMSGRK